MSAGVGSAAWTRSNSYAICKSRNLDCSFSFSVGVSDVEEVG